MAQIDALLKMLVRHGGDTIELDANRAPLMLKQGKELPVSFPKTSPPIQDMFLREVQALGGPEAFVHQVGALPPFEIRWGSPNPSSIRARLHGSDIPKDTKVEANDATVEQAIEQALAARQPAAPKSYTALADLLQRAVEHKASDLHLQDGHPAMLRVDGRLHPMSTGPISVRTLIPESERVGGEFMIVHSDGSRFRTHIYATVDGEAAALRRLPKLPPALSALNLPVSLNPLTQINHGLILMCGPTGSGKSTTLAALANAILQRTRGVLLTLEDPIEYLYQPHATGGLVRQRQLGVHIHSFADGLRDALRADPDIILVGEMRDPETIQLALTAAETGHLVLSTLHAPSAASSVERIVDSYPGERQQQIRVQLAQCLRAVVSQRLLPTNRSNGRVPAVEVLRTNYAIGALIRDGRTAQLASAMQTNAGDGCMPLERCLATMVRSGTVSKTAALEVANDRKELENLLR